MAEKNVRSVEWRRKKSIAMQRLVTKMLRLKKQHELQYAKPSKLKARAHNLAKAMLRKKVAGSAGADYAKLSSSQKIAVDRLMTHIPTGNVRKLATRLMPIVVKHEKVRLLQARARHDGKKKLSEAKSHRHRSHGKASAERNKIKRAIGKYQTDTRGEAKGTKNRTASRLGVAADVQRLGKGSGRKTKYGNRAREMMRALLSKGSSQSKNVRNRAKAVSKRAAHADRSRKGHKYWSTSTKLDQSAGRLISADVEFDMFADMITEGSAEKFEALFLRGLVPTSKIEIYKKIFKDLDQNIKYRRFQDDIVDILDKLVKLITSDNNVYNRIRNELQTRKYS